MYLSGGALFFVVFLCISNAISDGFNKTEEQCSKGNSEINNSVVMGCADTASNAENKSIYIYYKDIVRPIPNKKMIMRKYENYLAEEKQGKTTLHASSAEMDKFIKDNYPEFL